MKETKPIYFKKDNFYDCADKSDEKECKCNFENTFSCLNGQCIDKKFLCDGIPNCRDGSDEINCNETICDEFECGDKKCIPCNLKKKLKLNKHNLKLKNFNQVKWKCDGHTDCKDLSDEKNCNKTDTCDDSEREFKCTNNEENKCIPKSKLCDGHDDCGDGSDEKGCICKCEEKFSCKNICQCVDYKRICDGNQDCRDGSDEYNCTCAIDEYKCKNGICINKTKICDKVIDCPDADDEKHPNCGKLCFKTNRNYSLI